MAHEGYVAKDKDFNAILTSIKGKDFDVIFIPGYYQEAGLIIKQARDQGIDAQSLVPMDLTPCSFRIGWCRSSK